MVSWHQNGGMLYHGGLCWPYQVFKALHLHRGQSPCPSFCHAHESRAQMLIQVEHSLFISAESVLHHCWRKSIDREQDCQCFVWTNHESSQVCVSLFRLFLPCYVHDNPTAWLSSRDKETFRVYVILPLLPAFEGELGTSKGTCIQAIIHWNYQSISRGGQSLLERLVPHGTLSLCLSSAYFVVVFACLMLWLLWLLLPVTDPFQYISFYGLRTHEELLGNLVIHSNQVSDLLWF